MAEAGDAADESTAAGSSAGDEPADEVHPTADDAGFGAREVVVPLRVYKTVTVFSTLIAIVAVVAGFLALDAATRRASAPPSEIDPILAVVGLAAIALGGVVYAYASRFRAPGMGTSKNGDDQGDANG
jgi:hypothetical protein